MDAIEHVWLQLLGIISICYGCTSEPAFFLTTMDRLLDKLRTLCGKSLPVRGLRSLTWCKVSNPTSTASPAGTAPPSRPSRCS